MTPADHGSSRRAIRMKPLGHDRHSVHRPVAARVHSQDEKKRQSTRYLSLDTILAVI